jgi:DNA modification methylase
LEDETYLALMAGEYAQMVFTDPPYNVPISGYVGGSGAIKHREFVMASGEMTASEFTSFLEKAFENLAAHSVDGSIHFVCMDWRHMAEVTVAAKGVFGELKNLCVWVRQRRDGDVLSLPPRTDLCIQERRGANPTTKPVAMIADAIRDVSKRNGIVLDPFGGSGSTLVAAHKTGRRGYLAELDPIYVDRIIRRWQAYAKDDAILASSGETFDDISKSRKNENAEIGVGPDRNVDGSPIVARTDGIDKRRSPKTSSAATQPAGDRDVGAMGEARDGR